MTSDQSNPKPPFVHDAACESELTSHGYTPCQCVIRDAGPDMLVALKEMRDAMAAMLRVISMHDDGSAIARSIVREIKLIGIPNGFGIRAQQAIEKAEGRL